MPRVPLPSVGITLAGGCQIHPCEDVTPRSSLIRTHSPIPFGSSCLRPWPRTRSLRRLLPAPASPKLHPAEKLNRCLDILTVKSRLDRPTRASWKAMKTQADGILARHSFPVTLYKEQWLR